MTGLPRPFGFDVSLFPELSKGQIVKKGNTPPPQVQGRGQKAVKVDGQVVSDVDVEFQGKVHRVIEVGKTRIAQAAGK